jgi:hypothetical protein
MHYTLCVHYTLCAGVPSLGAKLGLPDDFLLESSLKGAKIRRWPKNSPAKFCQKIKTIFLEHD